MEQRVDKFKQSIVSYLQNVEKVNMGTTIVEPPLYPARYYQAMYPYTEVATPVGEPQVYMFTSNGYLTTDPVQYIRYLEYQRYNPNCNVPQDIVGSHLHIGLNERMLYADETLSIKDRVSVARRGDIYRYMRNYVEQLVMFLKPTLDRFPRYERLGLASEIRKACTEIIVHLTTAEHSPAERKTALKKLQAELHRLNTYMNFAVNYKYINFVRHQEIQKKLDVLDNLEAKYFHACFKTEDKSL